MTLVGTTESPYSGDPDRVEARQDEIDYLRHVFARHFPARQPALSGNFSGLRVLSRDEKSPFARPRDALIATDNGHPPRMVTACGGKLTTYRATAQKVLLLLGPALPPARFNHDTRYIPLQVQLGKH